MAKRKIDKSELAAVIEKITTLADHCDEQARKARWANNQNSSQWYAGQACGYRLTAVELSKLEGA